MTNVPTFRGQRLQKIETNHGYMYFHWVVTLLSCSFGNSRGLPAYFRQYQPSTTNPSAWASHSTLQRWLHNSGLGIKATNITNSSARTSIGNPVIVYSLHCRNSRCESFQIYFRHSTHKVPPFSRDSSPVSNDMLSFPNCPRFKWIQMAPNAGQRGASNKTTGCCETFLGKLWHGNTKSWNAKS